MSFDIDKLDKQLKESMTIDGIIHKRYYHSVGVAEMAVELNNYHKLGLDNNLVYAAGLLHDAAKLKSDEELWNLLSNNLDSEFLEDIKSAPQIWHSFAGKYVLIDEYGIDNEELLDAVFYHTTGKKEMSLLEMLIFVSDYAERGRVGKVFEDAREACFKGILDGVKIILIQTIDYLKKSGKIIERLSLEAYNYYCKGENE